MTLKIVKRLGTATSKLLSLSLTTSLALSPLAPAFADDALNYHATAGDTAKSLPDIGNVCDRLRASAEGNFVDSEGKDMMVTKEECLGKTHRQRDEPSCKVTVKSLLADFKGDARQKKIDDICISGGGSLGQAGEAFCNLRQMGKNSQSLQYCEAYDAAKKAEKGLKWVLALDISAAAVCWAEYLSQKAAGKTGGTSAGSVMNSGACGGVALAASLGEITSTVSVLAGGSSGGKYKVDSNNNVKEKGKVFGDISKTIEVIASAALSYKAIKIGVCYYNANAKVAGLDICKGFNNRAALAEGNSNGAIQEASGTVKSKTGAEHRNQVRVEDADQRVAEEDAAYKKEQNDFTRRDSDERHSEASKVHNLSVAKHEQQSARQEEKMLKDHKETLREKDNLAAQEDALQARADLAHQAAIVFTGLAAMRGVAIYSAEQTKKKTTELLQSMFQGGTSGTSFGGTAMSANNGNMFSATATAGFQNTQNQPTQSGATAGLPEGSLESYLSPPGSPLGDTAAKIARQIPDSKLDAAASGGPSGAAGLIASAASAMGAKGDLSAINGVASSVFANMPKEDGGYSSGGGGQKTAGGGKDSGSELNLKALFGGGDKEGEATSPGRTDIAFREPAAAEDIWHSQNPSGNNLFQIISGKYDHVQRRSSIGEGL